MYEYYSQQPHFGFQENVHVFGYSKNINVTMTTKGGDKQGHICCRQFVPGTQKMFLVSFRNSLWPQQMLPCNCLPKKHEQLATMFLHATINVSLFIMALKICNKQKLPAIFLKENDATGSLAENKNKCLLKYQIQNKWLIKLQIRSTITMATVSAVQISSGLLFSKISVLIQASLLFLCGFLISCGWKPL